MKRRTNWLRNHNTFKYECYYLISCIKFIQIWRVMKNFGKGLWVFISGFGVIFSFLRLINKGVREHQAKNN